MPETNTLAYYENSYITDVKSFITLGPGNATRMKRQNGVKMFLEMKQRNGRNRQRWSTQKVPFGSGNEKEKTLEETQRRERERER